MYGRRDEVIQESLLTAAQKGGDQGVGVRGVQVPQGDRPRGQLLQHHLPRHLPAAHHLPGEPEGHPGLPAW